MSNKVFRRVLVISDLHVPYMHPDSFKFLEAVKRKLRPDLVLSSGDLLDNSSISFHSKPAEMSNPDAEIKLSRIALRRLVKIFPKMDIVEGNHDVLIARKAVEHQLPSVAFRSLNDIFELPRNYKFHKDLKFQTPLGPVYLTHGKTGAAGKLSQLYGMNTVQGHFHSSFQITYTSSPERLIWDAHVGCLADPKSLAMSYAANQAKRHILGVLVIIDGIPQLIPMLLNKHGRWTGKL